MGPVSSLFPPSFNPALLRSDCLSTKAGASRRDSLCAPGKPRFSGVFSSYPGVCWGARGKPAESEPDPPGVAMGPGGAYPPLLALGSPRRERETVSAQRGMVASPGEARRCSVGYGRVEARADQCVAPPSGGVVRIVPFGVLEEASSMQLVRRGEGAVSYKAVSRLKVGFRPRRAAERASRPDLVAQQASWRAQKGGIWKGVRGAPDAALAKQIEFCLLPLCPSVTILASAPPGRRFENRPRAPQGRATMQANPVQEKEAPAEAEDVNEGRSV